MKITDVRALSLSRPHEPERQWRTASVYVPKADCSILIIDTDEGLQGISEPCAYGVPPEIAARVEGLKPDLLGRDPTEPDLVPSNTGERSVDIAHAGLDCALWDLQGKMKDKPVSRLLAGSDRQPLKRVRLYASAGVSYDWDDHPESVIDEVVGYAEAGYTAYKMRIGTEWTWSGITADRFLELARKVHDAVGDRMDLALDGNCRLAEADSLIIARALDEMGWAWFEEPIPRDPDGYARLNAAVSMPISGGESFTSWAQFAPYLEKEAYAIVQPDAGVCGITRCLECGRRAHRFGVPLIPHNWHNGLMTMANAHLVAALPDPRLVELNMVQGPLQWEILREKPLIEDGHLELPDRPGLGVDLADDLEERFPYIEGPWSVRIDQR